MFYVYLVLSVVLIPILNNFFDILRNPYSWWLVPLLIIVLFFTFVILQMALFVISVALTSLNSPAERGTRYFRLLTNISIPLLMKVLRVNVNSKGTEKVPEGKRMLFVCNHQHDFDPIIMMSVFPKADIGFIGKKEIYTTKPLTGKIMHKLYCLPIDRENNREAAKTIIEAIKILKDDKASIGLFPEGYVSKSCDILPFRNGSLKIAYKAEVPIVVCVINGTRSISKDLFKRHIDINFEVLDVISPDQFTGLHTNELGDKIHLQMEQALTNIRK